MSGRSRLDHVYRSILMTKFFTKGWGKPENLKRLFAFKSKVSNRETCYQLVAEDYPVTIHKEDNYSDCKVLEGHFLSPFVTHLPGIVPKEAETAHFQVVLPKKWNSDHYKPICLHLAGTGDHGFWRRRQMMAKPLLKEGGIGSIILENPFYGIRKPKDQVRSSLHNVSDIIVMGGCLILESLVLFHWCENNGFGPLGVTGMSMGGHMASLAATNWPKPIVLVPCLSWSSATPVFTQGVMSQSINWKLLSSQYFADNIFQEEMRKLVRVDKDAFRAGQQFAKHYPKSMDHIRELSREEYCTSLVSGDKQIDTGNNYMSTASSHHAIICKSAVPSSSKTNTSLTTDMNVSMDVSLQPKVGLADSKVEYQDGSKSNQNVITHLRNVPDTESNALSSLLGKQTFLDRNLLLQLAESKPKSKFLGFRTRDAQDKELEKLKENIRESVRRWREDEALLFMHGIMDECTHLRNFTVPVDTSLIIAICAKDDAYVPREGCADLTDIWPGAEVRFLDAGHVTAYLLHKHTFRAAIIESFQRLKNKYIEI